MKKVILCASFVVLLSVNAEAGNLIFKNDTKVDWGCSMTTQKLSNADPSHISQQQEATVRPTVKVVAFCKNYNVQHHYPLLCNHGKFVDLTQQDKTLYITGNQTNGYFCQLQ